MANKLVLALSVSTLVVVLAGFAPLHAQEAADQDIMPSAQRGYEHDDPLARDNYEWMRLRDPGSGILPLRFREKELAFAAMLPKRADASMALEKPGSMNTLGAAPQWQLRGPNNVGGRTRGLAIDVTDESVVLAGGISGALYRSEDGGVTWVSITPVDQLHNVSCIAQDLRTGHTQTWYYGTGEYRGNSADGGYASFLGNGIYKSNDGGRTFSSLASTASNSPQSRDNAFDIVFNIAVDRSNVTQAEVYAAAFGTIERSVDGGTTWTAAKGGNSSGSSYTDVAVTKTGVVYATLSSGGADAGLWRSPDGITWTNITPPAWPTYYGMVTMGIAPSNQNVVYFYASSGGSGTNGAQLWKYTYKSGNGSGAGGTWDDRTALLPSDIQTYSSYCQVVAVKPDDPNMVFVGASQLYRSTDGFTKSTNVANMSGGGLHADVHAITFLASDPQTMYVGCDGGVYATSGAGDISIVWTPMNKGYTTTQFYTCAIDHGTTNDIVIGGLQDNGTVYTNTTNGASPWLRIWGGDGAGCAIADSGKQFYTSYQNGQIYRLSLGPDGTQIDYTKVSPSGASGFMFITPFALDPLNNKMMFLPAGNALWRNSDLSVLPAFSDNGTTTNWTNLTQAAPSNGSISTVSVARKPAHRVYFGTNNGLVYRLDSAHVGNHAGVDVSSGKGMPGGYVSHIAIDPLNGDSAIVVFSNYGVQSLFMTTNGGASWTAIGGNLEADSNGGGNGPSVRAAAILPVDGKRLYFAATSVGLFSTSTLSGKSTVWTQEAPTTIGNVVVDMLDSRTLDGYIVAATHGAGMYSARYSDVPMSTPVLVAPPSGTLNVSQTGTIRWHARSTQTTYRLQISTNASFAAPEVSTIVTDTAYGIAALQPATRYFWRVQETSNGVDGPWSAVWSFTTAQRVSVGEQTALPVGMILEPVAPNPADGAASVRFAIPEAQEGILRLFDALGREVEGTSSITFGAGSHLHTFETRELHPGTYFYRLIVNGAIATRPFSVVR